MAGFISRKCPREKYQRNQRNVHSATANPFHIASVTASLFPRLSFVTMDVCSARNGTCCRRLEPTLGSIFNNPVCFNFVNQQSAYKPDFWLGLFCHNHKVTDTLTLRTLTACSTSLSRKKATHYMMGVIYRHPVFKMVILKKILQRIPHTSKILLFLFVLYFSNYFSVIFIITININNNSMNVAIFMGFRFYHFRYDKQFILKHFLFSCIQ